MSIRTLAGLVGLAAIVLSIAIYRTPLTPHGHFSYLTGFAVQPGDVVVYDNHSLRDIHLYMQVRVPKSTIGTWLSGSPPWPGQWERSPIDDPVLDSLPAISSQPYRAELAKIMKSGTFFVSKMQRGDYWCVLVLFPDQEIAVLAEWSL